MERPKFITDTKGNFYLAFDTALVSGYLPIPIPKLDPVLRWHGPKINLEEEWYPATTFMADYVKHEVVLRFFLSADKQSKIIIRPYTQIYGTGMHVEEAPTKEDYEETAALGLTDIGTVHSHCTAKAFASGIDTRDEEKWPGGLHMTVGNLDEKQYDLHARFAWDVPGEMFEGKVVRAAERTLQTPNLLDWFEMPQHAEHFLVHEPQVQESILYYLIGKPLKAPYPDWWKEKLVQPPPKQYGPPPMRWQGDPGWSGQDFFGDPHRNPPSMVDPPQPTPKRGGGKGQKKP